MRSGRTLRCVRSIHVESRAAAQMAVAMKEANLSRYAALWFVSLLICVVPRLFGANLLTNPNFDANVTGWTAPNCTVCSAPVVTWVNSDADALASGSAMVNNTISTFGAISAGQCVAVTAG